MAKPSKAKKLWRKIDASIQFNGPDELRQFFAAAAKFLIKVRHWDDKHPKTAFDDDRAIRSFHNGFEQFSKKKMRGKQNVSPGEAELLDLLRKASGWDGTQMQRRVAKKKLTTLRKHMKKRFKRFLSKEKQPLRGLRFYDNAIRLAYLIKKR